MNFNQLRYIVAVDEHRNFSRAAVACDVAQSTLSQEIQRLEKHIGTLIFDRTRSPVVPTLKGVKLLYLAREILYQHDTFLFTARHDSETLSGEMTLGVLRSVAPYLVPLFIADVAQRFPDLTVHIVELSLSGLMTRFQNGELDAAITIQSPVFERFYSQKLLDMNLVAYSANSTEAPISLEQIDRSEWIIHEELSDLLSLHGYHQFSRPTSGLAANTDFRRGSFDTIKRIVEHHGGFTLLPDFAALYLSPARQKWVLPLKTPMSLPIDFIVLRGFEKSEFIDAITASVKKGLN